MEGKQGGHATKKEKDQILVQICGHEAYGGGGAGFKRRYCPGRKENLFVEGSISSSTAACTKIERLNGFRRNLSKEHGYGCLIEAHGKGSVVHVPASRLQPATVPPAVRQPDELSGRPTVTE